MQKIINAWYALWVFLIYIISILCWKYVDWVLQSFFVHAMIVAPCVSALHFEIETLRISIEATQKEIDDLLLKFLYDTEITR